MVTIMQRLKRRYRFFHSYKQDPPWDTNISPPELFDFLQSHPTGRALDIGCGTGTNLVTIAEMGWQVDGIDYIYKAVRTARQKIGNRNLSINVYYGDFLSQNYLEGPYNLILDMGCYQSLPDVDKRIYEKKILALLAHDGCFYLNGFLQVHKSRRGIRQEDIKALSEQFRLVEDVRCMGINDRPATWLLFQSK